MLNRTLVFWALVLLFFGITLYAVQPILLPFIVGMLIAYVLDPAADKLEAKGFSRTSATLLICSIFFTIFVLGLVWLIPALTNQAIDLIRELPKIVDAIQKWAGPQLEVLSNQLDYFLGATQAKEEGVMVIQQVSAEEGTSKFKKSVAEGLLGASGKTATAVLQSTTAVLNFLSLLLITPVVTFYLLRDWDRMIAHIDGLLPRKYADTIREQCQKIHDVLAAFVRGTVNVGIILAAFYMIALSIAGLDYALVIGIVGGFAIIIPFIGTLASGLFAIGMAIAQYDDWQSIAIVAGIFALGQVAEGNFLTPKMVGDKVGLHPAWMIFGMLAGATLLGIVGILLAVPITATVGVLARFGTERYLQSEYYKD